MKGRPEGSVIRDRIIGIISKLGSSYGYEIYKIYKETFGKTHIRSIYYNLKKAIEKEELIVVNVKRELGNYSWGDEVEKVYFSIGPYAKSSINSDDEKKINSIKREKNKVEVDWYKEISNIINNLKKEADNYNEKSSVLSNQGKKLIMQRLEEKLKKIKQYSDGKIKKEDLDKMLSLVKIG